MEFTSDDARAHYDAVRDVLDGVVVGLDFDGTLSPVVDDPEAARLHPAAPGALLELAEAVRAVAVITGRPARQAIAMGDLDALGNAMLDRGAELFVFGQYGNERWSATEQRIRSPAAAARGWRASSASCRPSCAAPAPPGRTSRRRASRSRCTPAAWTTRPAPSSGW